MTDCLAYSLFQAIGRCLRFSKHVLSVVEGASPVPLVREISLQVEVLKACPEPSRRERASLAHFHPLRVPRQVAAWWVLLKIDVLHRRERCLRLSKATRVVATSARPFENLKERAALVRFRPLVLEAQAPCSIDPVTPRTKNNSQAMPF